MYYAPSLLASASRRLQVLTSFCASNRHKCASKRHVVRPCRAEQPDLVERIFGGLFGKKALQDRTPFGMKRMEEDEMYELYPASTTEFAQPLLGDELEIALFRPLLFHTRIEKAPLRLAYHAEEHGWSHKCFHERVDSYGAAVVLARTAGGAMIGGYNPQGWIGLNEDRDSNAAFLFTWPDGNTSEPAIKLPKVGGPNLAVLDGANLGIEFGAEGLKIPLQGDRPQRATSRLGSYYAKTPSGGRTLFAAADGPKGAQLEDLKVYVAEGGPEVWDLQGVVWKSSQE